MAFASLGSLGSEKTGQANTNVVSGLSIRINDTIPARTLLLLAIAKDNAATADSQTSEVSSVSDDARNAWKKAGEYCNGNSAAGAGATVSLWYCLTSVDCRSLVVAAMFTSAVRAAANIIGFSVGVNTVVTQTALQTKAADGAAFGSLSTSGLSSREYLTIRTVAVEGNPSPTASSSWTATAIDGPSEMQVWSEFLIKTTTGETSNPGTSGTFDNASVMTAFYETVSSSMMFHGSTF